MKWFEINKSPETGLTLVLCTGEIAALLTRSPHAGIWGWCFNNQYGSLGNTLSEAEAKSVVEAMVSTKDSDLTTLHS